MQSELQGLEITKGEFKHLSGLGMDQVYRPPTWQKFLKEGCKTLITSILILISYGILATIFEQHHPLLIFIHLLAALAVIIDDLYKIITTLRSPNLLQIFDEVDRYNTIVQAVILYDHLEQAGNSQVKIYQREEVITALKIIRGDLVRSLKTEKILRKNHQFISEHQELLETDFNRLIQPGSGYRSTEESRLLHQSRQLATEVHQKLKQLQQKHSTR
ncbi:MAG: hypothetical protein WAN66_11640 [Limnoraphis robusta]|uniref:Uncharacterized protein n=1 Tax=Limnoraphis robusta CS-951 TaxID=1637645 RepID=A0A0F5YEM0_9CYAN|nr:hypothetical protein [Limnoraphis robusta]KKD37359.1 hypothetical protein WN50_14760 [Limnoraphis robusta CS-951]